MLDINGGAHLCHWYASGKPNRHWNEGTSLVDWLGNIINMSLREIFRLLLICSRTLYALSTKLAKSMTRFANLGSMAFNIILLPVH
jgi:hypothetical protein